MVHNVGFREQLKRLDTEARTCRLQAVDARRQGERGQMKYLNLRAENIEKEAAGLRHRVEERRKKRRRK